MARANNTYRAERRNAARTCGVLNQWGMNNPLRIWHQGVKHEQHVVLIDGQVRKITVPWRWQVLVRPLPSIMRHAIADGLVKDKAAA